MLVKNIWTFLYLNIMFNKHILLCLPVYVHISTILVLWKSNYSIVKVFLYFSTHYINILMLCSISNNTNKCIWEPEGGAQTLPSTPHWEQISHITDFLISYGKHFIYGLFLAHIRVLLSSKHMARLNPWPNAVQLPLLSCARLEEVNERVQVSWWKDTTCVKGLFKLDYVKTLNRPAGQIYILMV